MSVEKAEMKISEELKKWDNWAEKIANNCEEYEQRYVGIPTPKGTCKLTGDVCEFDSCPKRGRRRLKT